MKPKDKDKFFLDVSQEANYMDPKIVRSVYVGMVRYLIRQTRLKGKVELPDFGTFSLRKISQQKRLDVNTREVKVQPPTVTMGFRASRSLNEFIKEHCRWMLE